MYAAITAIDDFMNILSFGISGKAHFYQLIRNRTVLTYQSAAGINLSYIAQFLFSRLISLA